MKEGWEYKKLGEVATFQRGLTYGKADEVVSSSKCVLRSNNIDLETNALDFSELKYLREDFEIPQDKKLKKGGIFICMSNGSKQHVGKAAYIEKDLDYAFGGFMGQILPDSVNIFPKFLFYFCLSSEYRRLLLSVGNGIGITNLKFSDLSKFSIPVPPLSEQQRIVEELDLLSSIIEKKKAQLKELESLAQSIFYDMFGDPVTNEKGWEVKKIGELASVKTGPFGSMLHKEDYISNGIPLVNPIHIKGFHIVADLDFTISNEKAEELNKYILQKGDVIFARRGDIGRCAVVSEKENGYLCGTGSLFVRFEVEVASTFIMYIIRSSSFTNELISNAKGTTMLNLNSSIIENLWLPLPPLPLQQQFAEEIEAIEQQKELIKQSIKEVETLFNSRMDYYFN